MKRKISSIISVSIISLSLIAIAIGATMIKKVTIIDFDHANKFENFSDPVLNKEEAITSGGGWYKNYDTNWDGYGFKNEEYFKKWLPDYLQDAFPFYDDPTLINYSQDGEELYLNSTYDEESKQPHSSAVQFIDKQAFGCYEVSVWYPEGDASWSVFLLAWGIDNSPDITLDAEIDVYEGGWWDMQNRTTSIVCPGFLDSPNRGKKSYYGASISYTRSLFKQWIDYRFIWTPDAYYFYIRPSFRTTYDLVGVISSREYPICRAPLLCEFENLTHPEYNAYWGHLTGKYSGPTTAKFKNFSRYQNTEYEKYIYIE